MVEHDSQKKKEDLENIKKLVAEFKRRINTEVRKKEKLYWAEEKDFRRGELPEKYTVKILYKQEDGKFEEEYLRKLERNWKNWKRKDKSTSFSRSRNLEGGIISEL